MQSGMRIGRTLPPAAAPIGMREIVSGIRGVVHGENELDRFRLELTEYFGVKHCFLVSSGKAALTLILRALKELSPDRDEVLIPAFTCYSVPSSIVRAGLKLRLCDLQGGLDFDFAQLSAMLSGKDPSGEANNWAISVAPGGPSDAAVDARDATRRFLAVVPTHLYGCPADVPRLRRLVRDPGVTIIEDAAQAMGEAGEGRKLGTLGDVSFFSLGRGKAFSTVEGGIILTDRDDIAEKLDGHIARLPSYGSWDLLKLFLKAAVLTLFLHPLLFWLPHSIPFLRLGETLFEPNFPILRMSVFQAGLAKSWQVRLQKLHDSRKKNVNRWLAVLDALGVQWLPAQNRHDFGLIRFPVRVSDVEKRGSLLRESARRGLGIMPVYPDSIDGIPELRGHIGARAFPVARSCARGLVTLPTHDYLTPKDVTKISRLLSRVLASELCEPSPYEGRC